MPFVDTRQQRARVTLPAAEYRRESSWWDGYAASLGMVIDEEMTISNALNREGFEHRRRQISDMDIDLQEYIDRRGRIDYDRIAAEYEGIKTTAELNAERAEMLRQRREYAQDVLENAPGSAQFLGAMNGYLLDPLSIATMPISYTARGAQGLSILSRIGQTAARAAAVEGVTEAAIQGIVFDYKKSIDSPYAARDAITAIATAAAGAAALGGTVEGISGYLRAARESVDPTTLTKGEAKAYEAVQRVEELLEDVPAERQADTLLEIERSVDGYNARTVSADTPDTSYRMDHVAPMREGSNTLDDISDIYPDDIYGIRGLDYYGTGDRAMDVQTLDILRKMKNSPDEMVTIYRAVPSDVDSINPGDWVTVNKNYAEMHSESWLDDGKVISMDVRANDIATNGDSIHEWGYSPRDWEPPISRAESIASSSPDPAPVASKESEVLQRTGLSEAYDQTAAEYAQLNSKVIVDGDDVINADDLIKEFDDELNGLDNVMRCVRG